MSASTTTQRNRTETMKFLSTAALALLVGSSPAAAFAPSATHASISGRVNGNGDCVAPSTSCLPMNRPFFADVADEGEAAPAAPPAPEETSEDDLDAMTMEEEVEMLVQKEMAVTKKMSNLRNEKGVEYAPWMGISAEDESKIRALMRDKTEARRKRQEQERDVSGNLFRDSQAQELSGTGLSYKVIDGAVELQWATQRETDTKGFVVKRRAAKTNDYEVIASYTDWGPLVSKGREGGIYRFLDSTVTPGGWVYRVSEEDSFGNQADICQTLVELETEDEQKAALIAGAGFAVFSLLVLVAGVALDPMNGY